MAYKVFDPKVDGPLHLLTREEACEAYEWFVRCIPERVEAITGLLQESGIELDFSVSSLAKLHHWFVETVQEENALGNTAPSPELFSVCNDIGVYISEMIKQESADIKWDLCTKNKKAISYHRPVLVGFDVPNDEYYVDLDYLICQYAHRILKTGRGESDVFGAIFERAVTMAGN